MWFDSWSDVVRTVVVGVTAYATLIALLRVSGKRTLAKLNAFDLVVTVAFGSTLATILLDTNTSWADGASALATLVGMQLVAALLTARSRHGRQLLTSEPTVLLHDGRADEEALRRERIGEAELGHAVRSAGFGSFASVAAVVLETDGSLSVIGQADAGDLSVLSWGR